VVAIGRKTIKMKIQKLVYRDVRKKHDNYTHSFYSYIEQSTITHVRIHVFYNIEHKLRDVALKNSFFRK